MIRKCDQQNLANLLVLPVLLNTVVILPRTLLRLVQLSRPVRVGKVVDV
jgi:hypothetical protein